VRDGTCLMRVVGREWDSYAEQQEDRATTEYRAIGPHLYHLSSPYVLTIKRGVENSSVA
jgi:hypothetical protein